MMFDFNLPRIAQIKTNVLQENMVVMLRQAQHDSRNDIPSGIFDLRFAIFDFRFWIFNSAFAKAKEILVQKCLYKQMKRDSKN